MRLPNWRFTFVFLVLFVPALGPAAAAAQTPAPYLEVKAVKEEVARLLASRDVGELANELARQKSTAPGALELLKKLLVFARAGHRARALETLEEIVAARDYEKYKSYLFEPMQAAAGRDDLAARRFFYERVARLGDGDVESFVLLWRESGDVRGLEKWLAERADLDFTWFRHWIELRQSLGTADEVYAALERAVRANPRDPKLVEKYLRAVVNTSRDVAWLADVVPTDSAWDAYALGSSLSRRAPQSAARLFKKSLSLPFTAEDDEKFNRRMATAFAVPVTIRNHEKQLRYWTKKALVELYSRTDQARLAQPLVEELTAMDKSDILPDEVFNLAGAVQASSGQRVVEAKILRQEAERQDSPEYWVERVQYYAGRREEDLAWRTFGQALEKFPYKAGDLSASKPRLQILRLLAWYGENHKEEETKDLFYREFLRAEADENYLFELGRIISDEYDEFITEIFLGNDLLPRVLAPRPKWLDEERILIGDVLKDVDPEKREPVWDKLEVLARRDVRNRAYTLAVAMTGKGQHRRAVPFLEELLKIAPEDSWDGLNYNREYVQKELFDAYLRSGDWRAAERMFLGGFDYWRDGLNQIALAAARSGDAAEALRLWKLVAKRDRRSLWHLDELAKTAAREPLREFYLEMKRRDPLSDVPDKALSILQ